MGGFRIGFFGGGVGGRKSSPSSNGSGGGGCIQNISILLTFTERNYDTLLVIILVNVEV